MTAPNVKPREYTITGENTVETIPYVGDFAYDEDESILFAAEAWINGDDVVVIVHDFSVHFSLADLLSQGIAQIDAERLAADKTMLIDALLPILKNAVVELESRQLAGGA